MLRRLSSPRRLGRGVSAVAILIAATMLLAAGAGGASRSPFGTASAAPTQLVKYCPPGYVDANLSWGEKCLHAGEFCKVGNPEYHAYGFDCPADGHLVDYGPTAPPPTTTPTTTTT